MNVFPQLASGAVAQFPWRNRIRYRTVRNRPTTGEEIELDDAAFEERRWELPFEDLSDAEWQALEDLHAAVQGSRAGFTFLDPGANLLRWSEDFSQEVWEKSGGLSVTSGLADPFGGSRAWELTSGSGIQLLQRLAAPGNYRYVGSAWVRTTSAGCELKASDGVTSKGTAASADGVWRAYSVAWPGGSAEEEMSFEIAGPAGATVEVFGMQAEAQASRSRYKRTGARGGVFAGARFMDDRLEQRFDGPSRHATTVRIVWTPSSI